MYKTNKILKPNTPLFATLFKVEKKLCSWKDKKKPRHHQDNKKFGPILEVLSNKIKDTILERMSKVWYYFFG